MILTRKRSTVKRTKSIGFCCCFHLLLLRVCSAVMNSPETESYAVAMAIDITWKQRNNRQIPIYWLSFALPSSLVSVMTENVNAKWLYEAIWTNEADSFVFLLLCSPQEIIIQLSISIKFRVVALGRNANGESFSHAKWDENILTKSGKRACKFTPEQ